MMPFFPSYSEISAIRLAQLPLAAFTVERHIERPEHRPCSRQLGHRFVVAHDQVSYAIGGQLRQLSLPM